MYVTLEPCCHTGRTGPCTAPIIRAGIARVVVGCLDDNPLVSGRGVRRLRRAGIRVDVGCLERECREQNRGFFRVIRRGRPWVTLKVAATLDGFIAERRGRRRRAPQWITGEPARRIAHQLRAAHDAVLVGAGTVADDDPQLTVRVRGVRRQPLRTVLDGQLHTRPGARLFAARGPALVVGAAAPGAERRARRLRAAGADVLLLRPGRGHTIPLGRVLSALAARGVQSLLVEGGSRVLGAFIAARLVDRVAWFVGPRLAGTGVPAVEGPGLDWRAPIELGAPTVQVIDGDVLVTADVA
jgi:diaminohydroxyphosphoribosylaminopyrimidine deaminase/5-amino-6-(5-phosphoribosylamino)uracil reductase